MIRSAAVAAILLPGVLAPAEESPQTRLLLTLVDDASDELISEGWATMFPPGERNSRTEVRPAREREEGALVFNAAPGEYTVLAFKRPRHLDGLKYVPVDEPQAFTLLEGETTRRTIRLVPRPLTAEEIAQQAPLLAFGTVTDPTGEPIAEAKVRVATGWGTLLGGGATRTNQEGEYLLRFGLGVLFTERASQLQAAQFWVEADGFVEQSRSQPYTRMALAEPESDFDFNREEVFIKGRSGRLDFVLSPAAHIEVRVVGADGLEPTDLRLRLESDEKRNTAKRNRYDQGNKLVSWDVLTNHPYRFTLGKARSVTFDLPRPRGYEVLLRYQDASDMAPALLELIEIQEETGKNVAFEPAANSLAAPPLPPKEQQRAQDLISRIVEANRHWLKGVDGDFPSYTYRYVYHDEEPNSTKVDIEPGSPGYRNHGRHQGATFWTALHMLERSPNAAFYRGIKETEENYTISFTFRKPGRMAIGAGVKGSWRGYFSRGMHEGEVIVDRERLTPRELRGDGVTIRFDDYTQTSPNRFVPQHIEVEMEDEFWFDWSFAWREPGLWLFQEGRRRPEGPPATSVAEVVIDPLPSSKE